MTLTVSGLAPEHQRRRARVELAAGDIREGVLTCARNPSYQRREVHHWWLLIPSALHHFEHDALSLQWSGAAVVHLIDEEIP